MTERHGLLTGFRLGEWLVKPDDGSLTSRLRCSQETKKNMHSLWRKTGLVVAFGLLALFMIGAAGLIWGTLTYANFKISPSWPWSQPAMMIVLWLMWQYLGGKGWPRSTAAKRKFLLRANPVSLQALGWSSLAGTLAIGALGGFWIVLARLVRMPPNVLLPENFALSPVLVASVMVGASLVAPITEESAMRGYLQTILEREFQPASAVMLSSFLFSLAHVTQGLSLPKLLMYFLVGVTFGTMAYLNDSILPGIPVHIAGDLVFFLFIWPHDGARNLVWQSGADGWFWLHVAQAIGFTVLSLLAFRQMYRSLGPENRASAAPRVVPHIATGTQTESALSPFQAEPTHNRPPK
jgi:membrane protease YdiL (CAAX protease family)